MDAFLKIYDCYFDDLYRYVLFRVGNRWDADDLVSDIFRKALEYSCKHGGTIPEYDRAWLFAIAHNRIVDHYRRKKETAYGVDPEQGGYEHIREMFKETSVQNECLEEALLQLGNGDREMVHLKYMVGFAYHEMSRMLDKTEGWLRTRMHRIRKRLAVDIDRCLEEG
ncbi:RNA polymerase sigma factor [Paenibacillus motobuensis]|uniref:RNA polymerase sigma factor n=1 Tax=Paenibacillus TaxID=44249 RepID=UPI00203E07FE|nr:RNA polymerase sigma factor [Paenibacillus lutimineralis]MCM3648667.1 RNA polymerase sigma factor [Paenibacillus motobuensis]